MVDPRQGYLERLAYHVPNGYAFHPSGPFLLPCETRVETSTDRSVSGARNPRLDSGETLSNEESQL